MSDNKVLSWAEYQTRKAIVTASGVPDVKIASLSKDKDFLSEKYTKKPVKTIKEYPEFDTAYDKPKGGGYGSAYGSTYGTTYGNAILAPRCYTTHKPLKIYVDQKEYLIYGGACATPIVKDADIYVGFEHGMQESKQKYPWNAGSSFMFHIVDGSVPSNLEDAKNLIKYLADNLIAGKKIHIGCIGGHGRTGTILAALVTHMTGNLNSIEYVRTNYCAKSVESNTQIDWLHKHWGIEKVAPSKSVYPAGQGQLGFGTMHKSSGVSKSYSNRQSNPNASVGYSLVQTVKPVKVKGAIWGF